MNSNNLDVRLATERKQIDDALRRLLISTNGPQLACQGFSHAKTTLREAIEYATLGAGKRIRPLLALRVARLLKAETEFVLKAALAVELIHCASLIIDDLPCMDNAEFRRGKPAVHVRFGEPMAILAAFSMVGLAADSVVVGAATFVQLSRLVEFQRQLLQVLGCNALAGGQAWDLELNDSQRRQKAQLLASRKTAPLFELAAGAGCVSSEESAECHERIREFATAFGILFQLINDLHDANIPQAVLRDQIAWVRELLNGFGPDSGELVHFANHLIAHVPNRQTPNLRIAL